MPHAQRTAETERPVQNVIKGIVESWNRHDVKAFAQLFAPDADFVNIGGKQMKGRNEIESHHATIHEGHYRDSHLTANTLSLRFLRPDVAIAHVASEVVYNEGNEKRTTCMILVLTNPGNRWLIAAAHNTLTGGSPIAPATTVRNSSTRRS